MTRNIQLIHFSSAPGGIEVILPVMVKNVPDRSFSAFVIRLNHSGNNVYENIPLSVTYGSDNNIKAFVKFFLYALRRRKDIFHVFNIGPVFLLLLRLAGAKRIIYSIHGTKYWKTAFQRRIYKFFWKIALKGKITLLANSEHSRDEFYKKISDKKLIDVLYNPIDIHRFNPGETTPGDKEIRVVYSGRLEPGKNLVRWIETAAYLHDKIPNTCFELYGEGSLKSSLKTQIDELHAGDYIRVKGFRKDIENVYRCADMSLFLSEYESFGNVVVESVLCGTPVITSPIPVMKEIFREFPQLVLSEPSDLKEQVLLKVRQIDELRKITNSARESFLKRFSVQQHIKSLQQVYCECER